MPLPPRRPIRAAVRHRPQQRRPVRVPTAVMCVAAPFNRRRPQPYHAVRRVVRPQRLFGLPRARPQVRRLMFRRAVRRRHRVRRYPQQRQRIQRRDAPRHRMLYAAPPAHRLRAAQRLRTYRVRQRRVRRRCLRIFRPLAADTPHAARRMPHAWTNFVPRRTIRIAAVIAVPNLRNFVIWKTPWTRQRPC